jgi:hypothetical protein
VPDIFDEVADDLRAERARQLVRRTAPWAIAAVLLVVGAIAGWQGWRYAQGRRDQAVATSFIAAMRQADAIGPGGQNADRLAAARAFAAIAAHAPPGYAVLARLREAALDADAGDQAAALTLWNQVSDDAGADRLLRDLATLLWVQHQVDSGDPATLQARLAPIASIDNAWRDLAMEAQALLDIRTGKKDDATATLKRIVADAAAPQDLRGRASALLVRLGAPGAGG